MKAISNKCQSGVHASYLMDAIWLLFIARRGGRVCCMHCKLERHFFVECDKFDHSSWVKIFSVIKSVSCGCLKSGHSSRFSKNRLQSSTCGGRHPTLLHHADES